MVLIARTTWLTLTVAALSAWVSLPATADVFILSGGGRVDGQLVNADETPRRSYVIQTASGTIVLAREQVADVVNVRPELATYLRHAPQVPDTVDGHWRIAKWCLDKNLPTQRDEHLQRIVDLDPDHKEARRLLGFRQQDDGSWLTQKQEMERLGLRYYKGRWLSEPAIKLLEEKDRKDEAEREWFVKIKRWRDDLDHASRAAEAEAQLLAIQDANAVPALKFHFDDAREARVQRLMLDALGRIGTPAAMQVLMEASLDAEISELRNLAMDFVTDVKPAGAMEYYRRRLNPRDENPNWKLNRAATALGEVGDESVVPDLITALVTKHKTATGGGGPNQQSHSFGTGGSGGLGGFSFGGRPKYVMVTHKNPQVRAALRKLTDHDFEYDEKRWRRWLAAERRSKDFNGRRD